MRPHKNSRPDAAGAALAPLDRRYPAKLADPWYDADHEVRRVRQTGDIKWRGEHVFIGEAFACELAGLADQGDGRTLVRFANRDLGIIGLTFRFQRFAPPRARLQAAAETEHGTEKE